MPVPLSLDAASPRAKAARFRRLANEILPGEFRTQLLELADSLETEAAPIERQAKVGEGMDVPDPD